MSARPFLTGGLLALLALLAAPAAHAAGAMLDVRLIAARAEAGPRDPRIRDIQGALASNLPFPTFEMIERAAVSSENGVARFPGGFVFRARGGADACRIEIEQNGRSLLRTELKLQRGKPALLGGFPDTRGRMIFAVLAR